MPSSGASPPPAPNREPSGLPRRAFLGLSVEARSSDDGVRVVRVAEGGTAQRAGARPGDTVVAVDRHPIRSASDLLAATRRLRGGDTTHITVRRDETNIDLSARATALPLESTRASIDQVLVAGRRLRTIVLSGAPSKAAVFYLQSADWSSCEYPHSPQHPVRRLLEGLTDAGFTTLRLEREGVGDSDGESIGDVDFLDEMAGYRAAFEQMSARHESVFLLGNSLGGMVAPCLVRSAPTACTNLAGIVVIGTSPATWHECMLGSFQRHNEHLSPDALAQQLALLSELQQLVLREGRLPASVFAERPHLRAVGFGQLIGDMSYGRTVRFFQQLEAARVSEAWSQVAVPVLALHGELDRVCTHQDARAIAALIGSHAEARQLEGVDHGLAAPSAVERVIAATTAWMHGVLDAPANAAIDADR